MEDVSAAFKLAGKYRQKFKRDVVVDLIGYRKMGHNELDQPSFTNPLMYKQVAKQIPVSEIYKSELIDKGVCSKEDITSLQTNINEILEENYARSKNLKYNSEDWMTPSWEKIMKIRIQDVIWSGIPIERVRDLGKRITTLPKNGQFHRQIVKIFE
jgi:2-oxoglutarate dehydrogenase E1 component